MRRCDLTVDALPCEESSWRGTCAGLPPALCPCCHKLCACVKCEANSLSVVRLSRPCMPLLSLRNVVFDSRLIQPSLTAPVPCSLTNPAIKVDDFLRRSREAQLALGVQSGGDNDDLEGPVRGKRGRAAPPAAAEGVVLEGDLEEKGQGSDTSPRVADVGGAEGREEERGGDRLARRRRVGARGSRRKMELLESFSTSSDAA
jgi:hypothetical protein